MTVALTYDASISRVRVSVASAPAAAEQMLVERSTDQVHWTVVRGGAAVPLVAAAAKLDDYEFAADVPNYYRVSYVDTGPVTFVNVGTATAGVNASVTPGAPASFIAGDTLYILASIRNSGAGTVNTPAGWSQVWAFGNVALLGKRAAGGDSMPLVTFAGGVANADTFAQCAAFRNVELAAAAVNQLLNGSAQDIAYPAITPPAAGHLVLHLGWKQDDWTSVATLAGAAEIGEPTAATGDDAGQVWDYRIQTVATPILAGSFVVTGGAAAISRGAAVALAPAAYITQETATISPYLGGVWLKSISMPFLNRKVAVADYSDVERDARAGLFSVIGRQAPVAVTDVRGSHRWTLDVRCDDAEDTRVLDLLLSTGQVLFVHVPAVGGLADVPGGYVAVGDTRERKLYGDNEISIVTLPLTEVAAPTGDVAGVSITWQGVLNRYPTWADLIAANATWADVLALVGTPADVVIP